MQYDKHIDQAIVNDLGQYGPLGYLELKKRTEKSLNRAVSFDTYNVHLKRMLKENTLNKQDNRERGKPVFYSLTENAKKQTQLNLLGINPKQILFRRIYEKVFFYEIFHTPLYFIPSEQELDAFLSEINATRNDLHGFEINNDLEFAKKQEELSFADTRTIYTIKNLAFVLQKQNIGRLINIQRINTALNTHLRSQVSQSMSL